MRGESQCMMMMMMMMMGEVRIEADGRRGMRFGKKTQERRGGE